MTGEPEDDPESSDAAGYEAELHGFPTASDSESLRARLPLEVLASQFIDRVRLGDEPAIEEYIDKYPRLADEIREFFPMVLAMERWKGDHEATVLRNQLPEEFGFSQLGDCRLVRELGRGGMGVVFEARRGPAEQRVAVKLLPWKFRHVPRWHERFEKEARVVSGLRHRNIVRVFSFGEHEEYCYYIMQFVEGVSLDWIISRLREDEGVVYAKEIARIHQAENCPESATDAAATTTKPQPEPRPAAGSRGIRSDSWKGFAAIGKYVSEALHYAHERDILHNDIKPANLLLDADGHVWVTDFGVAQSLNPDEGQEENHRLTGTLRFMAPERLEGQADVRSDVYSLGVTLYELITQTPAFAPGERGELVHRILEPEFVRPSALNKKVPAELEAIVLMAMHRDPNQRYTTAAALAADLNRFLRDRPTEASQHQQSWSLGRWLRRRG